MIALRDQRKELVVVLCDLLLTFAAYIWLGDAHDLSFLGLHVRDELLRGQEPLIELLLSALVKRPDTFNDLRRP